MKLLQLADQVLPLIRTTERNLSKLANGTADRLHIAIECHSCYQWLMPSLHAAVRSDMLEVPYMSDFLLTAKDISFATLEGVNAVSGRSA